jgi:MFS family permease
LARFGVGVGEAGGTAPSMALVGDLFPRERRGMAISILLLSTPLGMALGLLWGGWAVHELGWRRTFFLAGLAGAFIGPLVYFTLPEIRKGMSDGVRVPLQQPPFGATVRLLWSIRSLRNMMFAVTLQNFLTMGLTAWIPSFLGRSYGYSSGKIGAGLAVAIGSGLASGLLLGAPLIFSLGRRDLRWHFWVPTLATFTAGCLAASTFVVPPQYVFWLIGLQIMFGALFASLMGVITQMLVPVAVRATATACILFVANSVAIGLGPQIVGILSDVLRGTFAENSLRIALLCSTSVGVPAAIFYYRASLTYREDLTAADATYQSEIAPDARIVART